MLTLQKPLPALIILTTTQKARTAMSIDFNSADFDERLHLVDFNKTNPQTLTQETSDALDAAHAFWMT